MQITHARWLALMVLIAVAGCQQSQSTTSSSTTSSTTTTTTTPAPAASTSAPAASTPAPAAATTPNAGENPSAAQEVTLPSGLKYQDTAVGNGTIAETGMTATVHYTGWLTDGTKFDSSLDRGQPFSFKLGAGQVIRGWDEGVKGMRIGGKRKLTIPPDLGYGPNGTPGGPIPPNATLVFDVQLLDAK